MMAVRFFKLSVSENDMEYVDLLLQWMEFTYLKGMEEEIGEVRVRLRAST